MTIIISEAVLAQFRRKQRCEWCHRPVVGCEVKND